MKVIFKKKDSVLGLGESSAQWITPPHPPPPLPSRKRSSGGSRFLSHEGGQSLDGGAKEMVRGILWGFANEGRAFVFIRSSAKI